MYSKHYRQQLDIEISRYNPCLLITKLGKLFSLINNNTRGLRYVYIKLEKARLYIFINNSFANNKDLKIIRSVLTSEIYGITAGFNIGYVLNYTLSTIAQRLGLKALELVIFQLESTVEKRLIINLIAIRWINGKDNPVDAMTKALLNKALETLILINKAIFRVKRWV
ncbi:hypothetical protein GQ53DRAFT_789709 [Thozetella sp. PMI_491]|nr:hypothetical protein GQ53DRAFT_789709 [Thozetella sp. PMI_491]